MTGFSDVASPVRRALSISLVYAVVGALWIAGSDYALSLLFPDPQTLTLAQTYKGWAFVGVTSFLLFWVILRQFRRYRDVINANSDQAAAIRELSQFRESVIDNANIWIQVFDPDGNIVVWNKAAELISGYTKDQVLYSDLVWTWLCPDAEDRRHIFTHVQATMADGSDLSDFETFITTRDGARRQMLWNARHFSGPDGSIEGAIAIAVDVTEQREMETRARASTRQLKTLMDNLPGMAYRCLFDDAWTMKFVSDGCREVTGYAPDELTDNRDVSFVDMIDDSANEENVHIVEQAVAEAEPYSIEYPLTRRDGSRIWVWERGRSVQVDGELMLEGILMDISDRKALEQELERLATLDALTGLYNRREAERRLHEEISRSERYGRSVALLWIDLDRFKKVNDRHGHAKGDEVLRRVSQLIADSVRTVDIAARYGGEEFIVLLPERDLEEASATAERLRQLVERQVLTVDGEAVERLSVSIGIALFPQHADTADALCNAADQAMYTAKRSGRNQVCIAGQSAGERRKNPSKHL
ncbi:sensor domain-containing diguanylate cyclase [Marinobacter fonticola]|uniref:sensor domain-containing diguanylate cyclase n=1 Tax=Marinobacter fonticola TaxID=2603215 RepID=UPI0011E7CF41|nr:diguanylate cyclase [Marinobacter fonticola]